MAKTEPTKSKEPLPTLSDIITILIDQVDKLTTFRPNYRTKAFQKLRRDLADKIDKALK